MRAVLFFLGLIAASSCLSSRRAHRAQPSGSNLSPLQYFGSGGGRTAPPGEKFLTWGDHASWLLYVARQMMRAEDWYRLPQLISELRRVAENLQGRKLEIVQKAVGRLGGRLRAWQDGQSRTTPTSARGTVDPDTEKIFKKLLAGDYAGVKEYLRVVMQKREYPSLEANTKRLIIISGLLQYDGLDARARLPLWSSQWRLSDDDKIAALMRAKEMLIAARKGESADLHLLPVRRDFRFRNFLEMRVMVNLGHSVSGRFAEPAIANDPRERALLSSGMLQARGDYCGAKEALDAVLRRSGDAAEDELLTMASRLGKICAHRALTETYHAFCQIDRGMEFPLAQAVMMYPEGGEIRRRERVFWARLVSGDCVDARRDLEDLQSLMPKYVMQRHPYLQVRLQYMGERLGRCRRQRGIMRGAARHILERLGADDIPGAYAAWNAAYANRPSTPQAIALKTAILVSRYPKTMYSPCSGNNMLSGDPGRDAAIFSRLEHIGAGREPWACSQKHPAARDRCLIDWLKAYYIAGHNSRIVEYLDLLRVNNVACNEAHQIKACLELCGTPADTVSACRAQTSYERMGHLFRGLPNNTIGLELASRLCHSSGTRRETRDPYYILFGKMPVPLAVVFARYYRVPFFFDNGAPLFPPPRSS